MELEQIKKILERYNEGKCTSEESRLIEQWFEGINQQHTTQINENELLTELTDIGQQLTNHIQRSQKRTLRPWYYMAAAVAMLVAAGASFLLLRNRPAAHTGDQELQLMALKNSKVISNGYMIVTIAKGDTAHLTLEDGSTVILNAASKLRYPVHFTGGHRDLYLEEGEAFFNVAPQPGSIFTVHAGNTSTTALGTSFNIRAYTHEQKITVALLTGKAKVITAQQKQEPLILSSSEQVRYDCKSLELVKTTFEQEDPIGWQQGTLIFKDATYDEVRAGIENMYNVTIINQSDKKTWTYTGNFRKESLRNVMETICLTESLSFTIKKDTVLLKNKK
ncbi:FecR family protein [Chitinophaga sp. CF118]|uniref:FecR family protein n=1 Tax=Chitinophaga sp. CF118 TaxID=1884367 RepID=UPI0008EE209B|nr:FecR family protein [Chitinophaga sp. CF118]SFE14262.1 FecR family protein [Chitinophaga sp. CF118]